LHQTALIANSIGFFSEAAFSNASVPHSSHSILPLTGFNKEIISGATREAVRNIRLALAYYMTGNFPFRLSSRHSQPP
jgi:hypothetical protein